MKELELPIDYADRLLGYSLFTDIISKISVQLKMEFIYRTELTVLYDIIARQYLNALTDKIYSTEVVTLFGLQLPQNRIEMPLIDKGALSQFSTTVSPAYIKYTFREEIKELAEMLKLLPQYIVSYQRTHFKDNNKRLLSFIKSFLLKERLPYTNSLINFNDTTSVASERIMQLTPGVGEPVCIIRPFNISTDGTWDVRKVSIFNTHNYYTSKQIHFDVFNINVIKKEIVDDIVFIVGETEDKQWTFIPNIISNIDEDHVTLEWYLAYAKNEPKTEKSEPIPFYKLADFPLINSLKGEKFNEWELRYLMTEAEISIISLEGREQRQ